MANEKILLADDSPTIVEVIKSYLEEGEFKVITACDGLEALEKARKERPDLIILDLMLPKMDGYRVCGLLKSDVRYAKIPIVMFTARAQEPDKKIDEKINADAYITKDLDPQVLLAKVRQLLQK